jgi:flagellar protein FlgJ
MTDSIGGTGAPGRASASATGDAAHTKLKKASHDLESVFINELFKAMRQTVPDDGILSQDPGQDLFTGMLDERIAQSYAGQGRTGIGDALYHQLSRRLPDAGPA